MKENIANTKFDLSLKNYNKLRKIAFNICKDYELAEDLLHDTYTIVITTLRNTNNYKQGDELCKYITVSMKNQFIKRSMYKTFKDNQKDKLFYIQILKQEEPSTIDKFNWSKDILTYYNLLNKRQKKVFEAAFDQYYETHEVMCKEAKLTRRNFTYHLLNIRKHYLTHNKN